MSCAELASAAAVVGGFVLVLSEVEESKSGEVQSRWERVAERSECRVLEKT